MDGVATSDRYARSSSAQRFAVVCLELAAGASANGSAVRQVAGLVLSPLNFDGPHAFRDRCAAKRSELNLLKTQEIHRELQALMADVECVLKSQPTVNRTVQE